MPKLTAEFVRTFTAGTAYSRASSETIIEAVERALSAFRSEFGYTPKPSATVIDLTNFNSRWTAEVYELF